MKTILVPTDFSDTSVNASKYACGLAKQVGAKEIILYNSFAIPAINTIDPSMPAGISIEDFEKVEYTSLKKLRLVKQRLLEEFYNLDGIEIEVLARHGTLTDNINAICDEVDADVIVMGITGRGGLSKKVFGSNTTAMARHAKVPIIIVPNEICYKHISRLLLVSDFIEIEEFVPFIPIKKVLDETNAQLMILHVASSTNDSLYEGTYECLAFRELFAGYNPEFHFIVNPNFAEAINDFALENRADITIVIPKKHSLIESIFKKSHTNELVFHSQVPLMAVHEL